MQVILSYQENLAMTSEAWYVVKQADGHCAIVSGSAPQQQETDPTPQDQWGPFASQKEATARRVGLIRAGKCQPL
jgi:hypothetical protein